MRGGQSGQMSDYDRQYAYASRQPMYNYPGQQWAQQQQQPWQGYYQQSPVTAPLQQPTAIAPSLTTMTEASPIPASATVPKSAVATSPPAKKGRKKKEPKEREEKEPKEPKEKKELKRKSTDDEEEPKEGKEKTKRKKKEKEEKEKPPPKIKSHLHPPRQAQSAWQLFFTDELNKAKEIAAANQPSSPGGTLLPIKLNVAQIAKDAGLAYSQLNDEQKKYYAQKVQESKDQYVIDRAAWEKTLTPEDIRLENAYRAQQRKDGKSRKGNLKDPNAPKKPLSAYFLFLKGIREDDKLRAKVWGDESETTKQSVLAAERWRGLSDEDKKVSYHFSHGGIGRADEKPYLAQAEKDKADYEEARKLYESDAAARARGEDVPERIMIDVSQSHVDPPASLLNSDGPLPLPSSVTGHNLGGDVKSPFDQYTNFNDPLDGIDLGLGEGQGLNGQWDPSNLAVSDLGSLGGMGGLDGIGGNGPNPNGVPVPVSNQPSSQGQRSAGMQGQGQGLKLEQMLVGDVKKDADDFLGQ